MNQQYLESALNPIDLPVVSVVKPVASMEAADNPGADGTTKVEREIEIYGVMRNMDALDGAEDWEMQEQWGIYVEKTPQNATGGGIRVRMTQCSKGEVNYVQCIKTKMADGNKETELEVTVDLFEQFKRLANTGLRKKRYFFPIPNSTMKFEVDVFYGPAGTPLPHVKIDLELCDQALADGFDPYNVQLPFEMTDIRIIAPGQKNDEDLKYVRGLFRDHYDIPNQYLDGPAKPSQEGLCASMEEFPPLGCTCDVCLAKKGLKPSQERAFEEQEGEENLLTNKDQLFKVMEMCDGTAQALSYNGPEGETRIKQALKETSSAIAAAFRG